jgi:hypothetical protein
MFAGRFMQAGYTPSVRQSGGYFEQLPNVVSAAHAYWVAMGGAVPLEVLLEAGSAALREALLRDEPLQLDFDAAVRRALRLVAEDAARKEAA